MPADRGIELIRRVATACRDGSAIEPADLAAIGAAFAEWLGDAERSVTLDAVFGVARTWGGRDPRTIAADMERRRLLSAALKMLKCVNQFEELASKLAKYRAGAWRSDRFKPFCPERHAGKLEELLFKILKCRDARLCERQIRRLVKSDIS